jgi:predicted ribosome quality control (RQC) complex YloA/Tae2 family protein
LSLSLAELQTIAALITPDLLGAQCQRVRACEAEPHAIVLLLRAPGVTHQLLLSTTQGATRAHRVAQLSAQPVAPSAFIMLLRKRIVGARLRAVAVHDDDRILHLVFQAEQHLRITAELAPMQGNLLLTDEHDVVLGMQRGGHARGLTVGTTWGPPRPMGFRDGHRDQWPDELVEHWLEDHYSQRQELFDHETAAAALLRTIRHAQKRVHKRLKKQEKDLLRIESAEEHKREAELLQQAYGQVPRGTASIEVLDFYDPAQPMVTLTLDPSIDLQANIDRRFNAYRRYKRGEAIVWQRLEKTQAELDALAALGTKVQQSTTIEEVEALTKSGSRLLPRQRQQRRSAKIERLPYSKFISSDGLDMLVGRSAKDNDAVTFHVARGRDLWLHAADWPGSHVIIRRQQSRDVPRSTLEEAAVLAAHHCKGKADTRVTVRYTERKNVRKPKGAPAGSVSVAGGKTVEVSPTDPRLALLFERRPQDH